MDAGGRVPTVGALGDAGAVTEKYAWIKQHMTEFPTDLMCRFMQVSRSAYYAWLHRAQTAIETDDIELTTIIQALFKKNRATYGTRRLQKIVIKPRSGSQSVTDRLVDAGSRFGL